MPTQVGGLHRLQISPANPGGGPQRGRNGRAVAHPGNVFGEVINGEYTVAGEAGQASFTIQGISRDSQGNPLGVCTVILYVTGTDKIQTKVVSDAAGNWAALVPDTTTKYYAVMFDATGTVSGVTLNNLTGV